MQWPIDDTIAAIASAPQGALRGILRVSGPNSHAIVTQCLESPTVPLDRELKPCVVTASIHLYGSRLPCKLYLWPARRGYTHQPTVEIHTLGSLPLLEMLLRLVCEKGARLAEPGEFTLRAFLAGRLDLTQAEAVLGVIDAASQRELAIALKQLSGGMAAPLAELRESLLNLLADLEAELDFVEEDLEFVNSNQLLARLTQAYSQTAALLERVTLRATNDSKPRIVLYGSPNAGKSSLFNALAGGPRALVSEIAGTTRDYLQAEMEVAGVKCQLLDTAGLEEQTAAETPASPESHAQRQTRERTTESHLKVLCVDASQPLDAWTIAELARPDATRLVVHTKGDLPGVVPRSAEAIRVSSSTRMGLEVLEARLAERLQNDRSSRLDLLDSTASRCHESLAQAVEHLSAALTALNQRLSREFLAGDVRLALEELGHVAGTVVTDDLLDRIFSRFCIGK